MDFSHPNDVHGHIDWCAKMKKYNSLSEHLAALSFKFVKGMKQNSNDALIIYYFNS